MRWTKAEVRDLLGFTLDRELAEFFGVGKGAVSNWDEDRPIPEVRQWQARSLKPRVFSRYDVVPTATPDRAA